MRETVRCHVVSINKKIRVDIRITTDDKVNALYQGNRDNTLTTVMNLYPTVGIQILKQTEMDENGQFVRPPWNPNDILSLTKYNFPLFVNDLVGIQNDMKIPNLYIYQGKRLELNEEVAAKIRRVIHLSPNSVVEFSAVVISKPDVDGIDERIEGIKIKFNNEQSTTSLTLNELDSLVYNLTHLNIDVMSMMMYLTFIYKAGNPKNMDMNGIIGPKPEIDIEPLRRTFASDDDNID